MAAPAAVRQTRRRGYFSIVRSQGHRIRVSRSVEIDVAPDAFHRVVQDYARYPEFVPEVKAVRVGRRQGDSVEVTYWLDVKLKLFDFTLRHVTRSLERIEWTLVRGGEFMRANEGAWTLEPMRRGTRATYAIEIDLGPMVPGTLEKALAERGLPNMLANFRTRAESLRESTR
jgi:ribosome-associated toxin RatA of RatAB toxin-antitoxin module